jgi:hypothetical protein
MIEMSRRSGYRGAMDKNRKYDTDTDTQLVHYIKREDGIGFGMRGDGAMEVQAGLYHDHGNLASSGFGESTRGLHNDLHFHTFTPHLSPSCDYCHSTNPRIDSYIPPSTPT